MEYDETPNNKFTSIWDSVERLKIFSFAAHFKFYTELDLYVRSIFLAPW